MTTTKRRPDDQPFDFNLDAAQPDAELTPWVVQWNSRRWTFAHMQSLDCWELLASARKGEVGAMLGSFQTGMGKAEFAEFEKIPLPQYKLKALFKGWLEHCGLDEDGNPLPS
ncbi:hypothetical protein [Streptomyces corynorhini]|uniref:Uncharacterized protein n=1 Tax=Streptomyces corynorhini TaxID=2282652 RepID=A0A370BE23_9ACTN|nr:hypothetical protein [Streptomyces corynorhini]RDG37966.1 hypothetical protein DVH02_11625 [Streptomyces corynorhini]